MIKNKILETNGYLILDFPLESKVFNLVRENKWKELDLYFLEISKPNQNLFLFLNQFIDFNSIEHIIAIRRAPDDEEGIWHDDGSRVLGFSLSLNVVPAAIEGGILNLKRKDLKDVQSFSPLSFGRIIIFLTGVHNYEHQVTKVTKGERIVIAGWCS